MVVYGGTRYKEELKRAQKYHRLFNEFRNARKIIEIDQTAVDDKEEEIAKRPQNAGFNDAHIVAILAVSGCRLLCSDDKRADKYIKNLTFYPKKSKRPKIYRGLRHECLLCDANIVKLKNAV